jgi:hypothetical protein
LVLIDIREDLVVISFHGVQALQDDPRKPSESGSIPFIVDRTWF